MEARLHIPMTLFKEVGFHSKALALGELENTVEISSSVTEV